jgi:hypothetical protein
MKEKLAALRKILTDKIDATKARSLRPRPHGGLMSYDADGPTDGAEPPPPPAGARHINEKSPGTRRGSWPLKKSHAMI